MLETLERTIADLSYSDDLESELLNELEKEDFELTCELEIDERLNLGTDRTSWETSFKVQKDGRVFSIYLEGRAKANFSYERWVGSTSYAIDTISIEEE